MKKILTTFMIFAGSLAVFGQTQSIKYHSGNANNGWAGVSTTLNSFSTCQTGVSLDANAGLYTGVWSAGNYNVIVNGTTIGNYTGAQTLDLTAYIPVTSVQLVNTETSFWATVDALVTVTSSTSSMPASGPTVSANIYYCNGTTAAPLSAMLSGTGATTKWYTSANGDGYSATAPTPSTASAGTTSYWVSQATSGGCESVRSQIDVVVSSCTPLTYHSGAANNGWAGVSTTLSNFSTCQTSVSLDANAGLYTGVWGAGNYNVIVNGITVGNYTGAQTIDLTSYIPVNTVQLVNTETNFWATVDALVTVSSPSASMPTPGPTVSNINACIGQTASQLTATLSGTGATLKWYTSANGDGYSATAPTPSTTVAGTTSYWVAQATSGGCESVRSQIDVVVSSCTPLIYHSGTANNGWAGVSTTLSNFSTCQTSVSLDANGGLYTGVWSAGNYNVIVNGTTIGNYTGAQTLDLTSYIPVNTVQLVNTETSNWATVDALVTISSPSASMPTPGPTVSNVNACIGQTPSQLTATLSGTGATFKWYTSANGDGYSATAPTPSTTVAGTTSYWVAQATSGGCESVRSQIDVVVNSLPTVSVSGSNAICEGATTTLSPSTGGTWTSGATSTATVDNAGVVTAVAAGSASFTFNETATGCSNTTSSVTVNALPTVSVSGSNSICEGATTTLSPSTGGTWTSGATSTATVDNAGVVTAVAAGSASFTFNETATGCSNTTSSVTVNALPTVSVIGSNSICEGATTTLSPSTGGTWTSGATSVATVDNAGVVTAVAAGSASFTFNETATGCTNTTSSVTVNALPTVSVSGSNSICEGATTTLSPSTGGTWTSGATSTATVDNAGVVTAVAAGSVSFTFNETATGCSSSTPSITVNVCTGIEEVNADEFNLFPNPNSGSFTITINNPNTLKVTTTILDIQGKTVYTEVETDKLTTYNSQLNLSDLSKGIYFIKVQVGTNTGIKKLIIE